MTPRRPRRALVVGGTGFLGGRMLVEMSSAGWQTDVLDTGPGGNDTALPAPAGVPVHRWNGEYGPLATALRTVAPDVVILLAAHFVAEHTPEDIDPLIAANVRLPTLVMEAALAGGVSRLVMASTFWEESSAEDPYPVDLYAATRRAAGVIAGYYADAHDWAVVRLRVSDLYGPADRREKLFAHLRRAAETGEPLPMSPGEQLIDLVHVDDAARAFEQAARLTMDKPWHGVREYGVFSGHPLQLRTAVSTYARVLGRPVPVSWSSRPYRSREVMEPRTIPGVPGWSPSFDLETGLRDMERGRGGLLSG